MTMLSCITTRSYSTPTYRRRLISSSFMLRGEYKFDVASARPDLVLDLVLVFLVRLSLRVCIPCHWPSPGLGLALDLGLSLYLL